MIKVINNKPVEKEARVLKWYNFTQNNSGGRFDCDDDLAHRLFIEAYDYHEAERKAEDLGVYFNGVNDGPDCPCCGDRWYSPEVIELPMEAAHWRSKEKATFNTIEEVAQWYANEFGWTSPDAYIYYHDGRKSAVYMDKKEKK